MLTNKPNLTPNVLLTAGEVCKRLGYISRGYLSSLVKAGKIKCVARGAHGWKLFEEHEVERFSKEFGRAQATRAAAAARLKKTSVAGTTKAKAYDGKVAARVFKALQNRATLAEVVIECQVSPVIARALWEEWRLSFEDADKLKEEKKLLEDLERQRRQDESRLLSEERIRLRKEELEVRREELRRGIGLVQPGLAAPREAPANEAEPAEVEELVALPFPREFKKKRLVVRDVPEDMREVVAEDMRDLLGSPEESA